MIGAVCADIPEDVDSSASLSTYLITFSYFAALAFFFFAFFTFFSAVDVSFLFGDASEFKTGSYKSSLALVSVFVVFRFFLAFLIVLGIS